MEKRMKKNPLLRTKSKHPINKPVLYTTTFLLLAVCLLPLTSSTTPAPSIHLPDGPVTMIATDGQHSYFDISLSDVPPDLDVSNGDYKGWCADRSTVMPRGEQLTIRLYNSYDHALPWELHNRNWSKVNYILNNHDGATKTDIQDAFWYLLCGYPYSSLSSTAKTLADTAEEGFVPQPGELIAIITQPIQNDSNPWPFQIAFLQVTLPSQENQQSQSSQYRRPRPSATATATMISPRPRTQTDPTMDLPRKQSSSPAPQASTQTASSSSPNGPSEMALPQKEQQRPTRYSHAGVYQVSLKVTDNFGLTDTDVTNATITVRNNPPTLFISGPVNGTTNTIYSYAFSATDQEPLITYQINWGDGTPTQTATLPSGQYFALLHSWNTPGAYTITVTASDGSLATTSEKNVVIHETPLADNILIAASHSSRSSYCSRYCSTQRKRRTTNKATLASFFFFIFFYHFFSHNKT